MPVEVRRAGVEDWSRLKALRLEALADTPIGFLETLEQAQQHDDRLWRERAARGAEGGESFQVLALDGDRPVATCVSFVRDGTAWLGAVYVSAAARGDGLLARMVQPCADWARGQGRSALLLEVHEDNLRARRAYEKLGFAPTGATRPYPLDPSRQELEMALPLAGP